MSMDRSILWGAIKDRNAWERVKNHVKEREFSPPVAFWWKIVCEYYSRDSTARTCDVSVLQSLGDNRISNPKHRDALISVISEPVDASAVNVVSTVLELKRYNATAEFASAAMANDREKATKLLSALNELWERTELDPEQRIYAETVERIFERVGVEHRIPVLPKALNERIGGGVLPGHHILVFGRTEVGKSAFTINMGAGFLRRGKRVLYVGNEDDINSIKLRFIGRVLKRTRQEIDADRDDAITAYRESGAEDNMRLVHLQPGSISSIRRDIEDFRPDVLIVDQIRNLSGPEDGMTQRLEGNAIKFRNLLSEYGLIGVSVTQAGDRSDRHNQEPPIWLGTGDVDSSRVGLPGTVDLMLGIGANSQMLSMNQRAISLCKNKLDSGPHSREGFIVNVDLSRSIIR